jgi:hypothetical protein
MSRSRKKTPIIGNCGAESEKKDKKFAHRAERKRINEVLHEDPESEILPERREAYDNWNFSKDGKHYIKGSVDPKLMRK